MDILTESVVSVGHREGAQYPQAPPFHPDALYPEYLFDSGSVSAGRNDAYQLVRECLASMGLDAPHFGSAEWNPLAAWVHPGDTVVLKPNWVIHEHEGGGDLTSVVTHSSVVRAVADFVLIALRGRGRLILADAPLPCADFRRIVEILCLEELVKFLRDRSGVPVEVRDLRKLRHVYTQSGILGSSSRLGLSGDPQGYSTVDLAEESEFHSLPDVSRLYGADYDRDETIAHHTGRRHEYLISGTILQADVVISLPKLKVHRKVGATLNLKNLVGINGDKNYLPHFQVGAPSGGGDEFPDSIGAAAKGVYGVRRRMVESLLTSGSPLLEKVYVLSRNAYHAFKRPLGIPANVIQAGDWYGNDTAWRMVLDLNKILHYADASGRMTEHLQRRFFSIIDGIIAGEGEGPLLPVPKKCGLLIAGGSPLATDLVALRMMGMDWRRLRLYSRAVGLERRKLMGVEPERINIQANDPDLLTRLRHESDRLFDLRPPRGWIGHCEVPIGVEEKSA
jgi:uncharacterized protein (DUF362 family)